MKFVLYTAAGSVLMLVGIIALGAVVSSTSHTAYSLDLATLWRKAPPRCRRHPDLALPGVCRGVCREVRRLPVS